MTRQMLSSQRFNLFFATVSAFFTIVMAISLQGCGGETPEFDKSSLHSPETLVQEFVVRYKALPAQASAKQKARTAKSEKAQASLPDVDAESSKSSRKEAAVKSKMVAETQTLDNLIDTLEQRLGTVNGVSKREAAKKAVELIEKEPTIKDEDRKIVVERLNKLG